MNTQYNYYLKERTDKLENINNVAKNTYLLLSMTILFSALMAFVSIKTNAYKVNLLYYFIISFSLLILINIFKNSIIGLLLVFAFTGFLGYELGPLLKVYLNTKTGENLIIISLSTTGFIFLFLSSYILISKKNLEFLRGFILTGTIAIIILIIISLFIKITLIQAVLSGAIIILSSAIILHTTNEIIQGEEKNYILATISLYIQIYNIFINLLNLLNIFSSKE